jgi:hypothetical protein
MAEGAGIQRALQEIQAVGPSMVEEPAATTGAGAS